MVGGRVSVASGLVLVLVTAVSAGAAPSLPAPSVSPKVVDEGGTITVSGSGCTAGNSGLGYGYSVNTKRGDVYREFSDEPPMDGDSFTATDAYDHLIPGKQVVAASCFDGPPENNSVNPYPTVAIEVKPMRSPSVESSFAVSPDTASAGDTVNVHGDVRGGGLVAFYLYPQRVFLGDVASSPANEFDRDLKLPTNTSAGGHDIIAISASNVYASGSVNVESAAPPATAAVPGTAPPTTAESTTTTLESTTTTSSSTTSTTIDERAAIARAPSSPGGGSGALLGAAGVGLLAALAGVWFWRRRVGAHPPDDEIVVEAE